MTSRMRKRFLDCKDMTLEEAEHWGKDLCELARDVPWLIGDLARFAKAKLGENYSQVFPPDTSPGMIERYIGVAQLYPREEDRQYEATHTQYKIYGRKPDREARLQAAEGVTTDESRKADQEERAEANRPRWLLAVDVNYHLHRHWFSGAGVEAAVRVSEWLQRTVARLKEKGLSDVVCCFDSRSNHRKELTKEWEDKYKDRPPKDPELVQQLQLVRELLEGHGFACFSVEGMEGDDCMASFAAQFEGRITLLSPDKDVRQCLSDHCNILLDVEWTKDETSGEMLPDYKWLAAKQHTEATGIRPDQWAEYQTIMGDTTDGVKGVVGIGETGAAELLKAFGTVEAAIEAAKADDGRLKAKKREALIEFEAKLEVTRQLVTLKTNLPLPSHTRV